PHLAFQALGYETAHHGDGRWNGVAIASRIGLTDVQVGFAEPLDPDAETRIITARCGGTTVCSVYVPNGRSLDSDHYIYKLDWLAKLRDHLSQVASPDEEVAVCGDFNIAPADIDVWSPEAFVGATHTSQAERDSLEKLESWGLVDAFRKVYSEGGLFTYWDYQAGDFHEHRGMRIDLILASAPLAERISWAVVDRNARKGKLPSDHAPLLVDFN
ncbi:MAG: exodeoxyribonuclease III, partial [Acidimicrobiales bacterium]